MSRFVSQTWACSCWPTRYLGLWQSPWRRRYEISKWQLVLQCIRSEIILKLQYMPLLIYFIVIIRNTMSCLLSLNANQSLHHPTVESQIDIWGQASLFKYRYVLERRTLLYHMMNYSIHSLRKDFWHNANPQTCNVVLQVCLGQICHLQRTTGYCDCNLQSACLLQPAAFPCHHLCPVEHT